MSARGGNEIFGLESELISVIVLNCSCCCVCLLPGGNEFRLMRRNLRDTSDPFQLPEGTFRGIYRMSRHLARSLVEDLLPHKQEGSRNTYIPNTLRGSYQKGVGTDVCISMSQASVSRCIGDVNEALMNLAHVVKFPTTLEELNIEKQRFLNLPNGYPGIIGAIDCSHVGIVAPPVEDEEFPRAVFLNRKGFFSLNVQTVVNAQLMILNVNARFPGSVHDSAIWSVSLARQEMVRLYEAGHRNCWIIGDSGYPLEPWLMTTFSNDNLTDAQQRFNRAHRSLRNVVERTYGVWKGRFRCILKHRILHYDPRTAAHIVNSTAILHNYCVAHGEIDVDGIEDNEDDIDQNDNIDNGAIPNANINNEGRQTRNRIVEMYF